MAKKRCWLCEGGSTKKDPLIWLDGDWWHEDCHETMTDRDPLLDIPGLVLGGLDVYGSIGGAE